MTDLILETRLDVLLASLKRVQDIGSDRTGSLAALRSEVRALLDLPRNRELTRSLREAQTEVSAAKEALDYHQDVPGAMESLAVVEDRLAAVQELLRRAQRNATELQARVLPLQGDGSPWGALQNGLIACADRQVAAINEVKAGLVRGRQDDDGEPTAAERAAWNRMSAEILPETGKVFTEYLDLLNGLALRDSGVDQGLCGMADRLFHDLGNLPNDVRWDSLTIPAPREALDATLARIIRLGFPEWTVWALPLAAHEFGHVAVSIKDIDSYVRGAASTAFSERALRICLADAVATWVIGPAYACASLLIRLDPVQVAAPEPGNPVAERAAVVLATLEAVDGHGSATERGAFRPIIEQLRGEWEAAVLHATGAAFTLGAAPRAEIEGCLTLLDRTLGQHRAFSAASWRRADAVAPVLTGDGPDDDLRAPDYDVATLLNAAWIARLDGGAATSIDEVATRVLEAWKRIEKAGARAGRAGPIEYRPPRGRPQDGRGDGR